MLRCNLKGWAMQGPNCVGEGVTGAPIVESAVWVLQQCRPVLVSRAYELLH